MEALFACTRCHTKHPFHALSSSDQLCKVCRNNYSTVKCSYCRSEFQQDENSKSVCKKCYQNVKIYGKPSACEYCSITAAFIGKRCQRCANSEKKWGTPVVCKECKQKCAFERDEDNRRKTDGKLLCWLCTMSYKRVMAKARKGAVNTYSGSGDEVTYREKDRHKQKERKHKSSSHSSHHKRNHSSKERLREKAAIQTTSSSAEPDWLQAGGGEEEYTPGDNTSLPAKKPRTDITSSSSNGLAASSPSLVAKPADSSIIDAMASTENLLRISQLKDEVDSLKKQLQQKESQLLDKEKNLTILKAKNFENEKDMKKKLESMQKDYEQTIENLQTRNRDYQKQVASLTKEANKLSKRGSSANLASLSANNAAAAAASSSVAASVSSVTIATESSSPAS